MKYSDPSVNQPARRPGKNVYTAALVCPCGTCHQRTCREWSLAATAPHRCSETGARRRIAAERLYSLAMDLVAVNKLATAAASAPRSFFSMRWFGGNLCHYFRDKKRANHAPNSGYRRCCFFIIPDFARHAFQSRSANRYLEYWIGLSPLESTLLQYGNVKEGEIANYNEQQPQKLLLLASAITYRKITKK
jgi:hypothetical protein